MCMYICTCCAYYVNNSNYDILHTFIRRLASFLEHVKKNNQDEGGVLYRLDEDAIHTGLDINKAH